MRIFKFLAAFILTAGLTYSLNRSWNIKGAPLPAVGSLLNPFSGFWRNGDLFSLKSPSQTVTVNGLQGSVTVKYDDRMVPHIFADNLKDAVYVQGRLHAQNRLFQMDFITRATAGRLTEFLGESLIRTVNGKPSAVSILEIDKLTRRKGLLWAAENAVKGWQKDPATFAVLESYVAGVNDYIASMKPTDYPIEYKLLGVKPEPWTALKTALFSKAMANDLAGGDYDLEATNAKLLFGKDFDFLYPEFFKEQSPIVPKGTLWTTASVNPKKVPKNDGSLSFLGIEEIKSGLQFNTLEKPDPSNGSNNWAVAKNKTKDKYPILCGDPHLGLSLPSIWYELQITTPDINVYGVSLPGIPMVIIGFNNHIAWTQTNSGFDVADWYAIQWKDAKKESYLLDGAYIKAELKIEPFLIKDKGLVYDTVKYTVWGPVVYTNDSIGRHDMALRWLGHDESDPHELSAFVNVNKAKNWQEFKEALKTYNLPSQNFAFACTDGDIGLQVNGLLPIKEKEQGRFVQDGSKSANAWKGFVPRDQNPQYRNPARGFISSANQQLTDPSYPYYYNSENFESYRNRIINNKLEKMDSIRIEDMMKMQNDNSSLFAAEALPLLIKNLDSASLSVPEKTLLDQLKPWNMIYDKDKIAPVLFEEWYKAFYTATWDEILTRKGKDEILKPATWRTVFLLRDDPNNIYFDDISTPARETARDMATISFKKMCSEYAKIKVLNPALDWAKYKDTKINHLLSIPAFSRSHLDVGGSAKSINAIKPGHGPSWRMIVQMSETPKAWVVFPGGESGNPGSKNYDDFLNKWIEGSYYEALFLQKKEQADKRIILTETYGREAKK